MFNLEKSIIQWLKLFAKHRAFDHGSLREMELHLRDHIDDLISEGHSEQQAFDLAVEEFGEIPIMADEEYSNIKRKTTIMSFLHTRLLNNYFKTSIRSLMRNPLSSMTNIFGLSMAIGICLIVYAFINDDISIDQFHKNKNEVYLATFFADRDGESQQYGQTPTPLGEMLRADFTHIKRVCRVEDNNAVLKYEDKVFHEKVRFADPEFLEMFTFPMKWGLSNSLADMNSVIFSEEMSIKYFGDENPIGQDILMKFSNNKSKTFTITGVAADFPKAHAIEFAFLINFENFRVSNPNYDLTNWAGFVNATLIQFDEPSDIQLIEQGMEKYRILQNKAQKDRVISAFSFVSLADLHDKSGEIRNDISFGTSKEGWIILSIMAGFILTLACFNYINIAIVSASKRLKEIGIRKVIGANRGLVIVQFLAENIFITFFALILGLILGATVFIPWFNGLFDKNLQIVLYDMSLWIFLSSMLLFTGIASGIYPALYISKFQVIGILKGSVQFGKKNPLTKIFLSFQLVLTFIAIFGGVLLTQNSIYQINRSWGYNPFEALYIDVVDQDAYEQLHTIMAQNPNVLSISGSSDHLGKNNSEAIVSLPDRQYEVHQLSVDANYFETMGLELANGRVFKEHSESDKQTVVINELMVNNMALEQPLGQVFKIDSTRYEIIGVVKDFHSYDFDNKIRPTIFKLANKEDYRFLSMRVREGTEKESFEALQTQWAMLFPEIPFQGGHQHDVFIGYFEYMSSSAKFMRALAFTAVLLSGLGLYGLMALNVSGRVREFSIRKVLGAKLNNIALIITRQYVILFVLAILIGSPASLFLLEALMDTVFAYHIPMNYSGLLISILTLAMVLLATVFTQVRKVVRANPVEGLKVE
jgi:putative ABC transport system permease protein